MADTEVARIYLDTLLKELDQAQERVKHCANQLSDEDMWWGPEVGINSMGTIIHHLCGNVRQWVISGVGGAPDTRDRPSEFAFHERVSRAALLAMLDAVVAEARAVIADLDPARIAEKRRVQGFDETILSALFDTISHFKGHTYQMLLIARMRAGDNYELSWKPASREQGA